MKREQWSHSRILEARYERDIQQIISKILPEIVPGMGMPIKQLSVGQFLEMWSRQAAMRMVTGQLAHSARTWREAAREGMRGPEVYQMLRSELAGPVGAAVREIVERNAELIRSVPWDVAEGITRYTQEQATKGIRAAAMEPEIRRMAPELASSRIRLIARTEVSKASTALTRARSEELDLPAYVWRTSKDARVRSSHRHMDGVICFWDDPPSPEALIGIKSSLGRYTCGDAPNDRCFPEPILRLGQITFPAKVYRGGSISRMTRAAFARIAGVQVAA